MAFAAKAPTLNNRQKFRSFFRTVSQLKFLPEALVEIAIKFEWKQMAVITQTENLFTTVCVIVTRHFLN